MAANVAGQGVPGAAGSGFPTQYMGTAGYSTIGYQGMAPTFQSYPYISPFDNALEQHVNSDGLWYREAIGHFGPRGRRFTYDVQVEWLRGQVRNFNEQVGDPNAPTVAQQEDNELLQEQVLRYRMFFPPLMNQTGNVQTDGIKISTSIDSREGWSMGFHALWTHDSAGEFSARRDREQYRGDEVDSLVFAITGGIGNPGAVFDNQRNTSDLALTLDLLQLSPEEFDSLDLESIDWGLRGSPMDVLDRTLLVETDLPLQNRVFAPLVPNDLTPPLEVLPDEMIGVWQRFDLEFSIRHAVETYGAGGHFESNTLFVRGDIPFRGLIGGRYMRINEGFHFFGLDSGLGYTITNDQSLLNRVDDDGDFFVDDLEEGGAGGDYVAYNTSDELLIRAFVDSQVESDLAGPEFGLTYDLSDKLGINISGSTRVGALINNERLRLAGDNIGKFRPNFGDPSEDVTTIDDETEFDVDPVTGDIILSDLFDTSTSNGQLTQNAFTDAAGSMHVSPMFEQNLTANIPLFNQIPVLKDMHILQDANLQLGWTFLYIREVAEPEGSIIWESNPRAGLFPTYDVKRSSFYQNTFRLGVNCRY